MSVEAVDKKDTLYEDLDMPESVYVIAECGINHDGSIDQAQKMIDAAAEAGADAVKFQVFSRHFDDGKWARYSLLSEHGLRNLKEKAEDYTLDFIVTAFDEPAIQMCEELDVKYWKIPSGEVLNQKYLTRMAVVGAKQYYISMGMASAKDIGEVWHLFPEPYVLMHCVSEYPAELHDLNLSMIDNGTWDGYGTWDLGFSNHAMPSMPEIPIAAVALGATVVEIHFTLDRELPGADHFMSYEPDELAELILRMDNVSMALGDGVKRIMPGERKLLHVRNRYK